MSKFFRRLNGINSIERIKAGEADTPGGRIADKLRRMIG